jgi:metallophosphoesterase (TIGR00282 family)
LTAQTADEMFESGVDFITSGNHIFDKRDFKTYLDSTDRVIRPANYPPGVPGRGYGSFVADGTTVGVLNLMGRTFMPPVDDPFRLADQLVEDLRALTPVVIVDMHAEATSEKVAIARFLDGRASLVYGTHTHVQTADEQILAGGTAYLSDVGMTGPTDGVIGMEQSAVLDRFLTSMSERFSVQKDGPKQFCGAVVNIDRASGKATDIKRIFLRGVA